MIYETQRKSSRQISSCLDYVTALRVIMNTYAYCGTHRVAAADDAGKQIVFFPFEAALGYVDEVTVALQQINLKSEPERLAWLRKRDEAVRSEMVALINDGFSGGEAIGKAWSKLAHMWIMRDHTSIAASTDAELYCQPFPPAKRQRQEEGGKSQGKGKGNKQTGKLRTSTKDRQDRKICGAFNSAKGCVRDERSCPQGGRHVCSVLGSNNIVCASTKHNALGHGVDSW